jgi:hypothetical protein
MTNTTAGISSQAIEEALYGKQTGIEAARTSPRVVDPSAKLSDGNAVEDSVVEVVGEVKASADSWVKHEGKLLHLEILKLAHAIRQGSLAFGHASDCTVEDVVEAAKKLVEHIEEQVKKI